MKVKHTMTSPTDEYFYFNGCSFTYGIGIRPWPPSEDMLNLRWSKLLSNKYGVGSVNNSTPGSCNERIFRTTFNDILNAEKRPKLAVIMWSDPPRTEIFRPQENELSSMDLAQINPQSIGRLGTPEHLEAFQNYYAFINSEERCMMHTMGYMVALKFLFETLEIPFIMLHYKPNFYHNYLNVLKKWVPRESESNSIKSFIDSFRQKAALLEHDHIFGFRDNQSFDSLLREKKIPFSVYSGGHPDGIGHEAMYEWLVEYIDSNNVIG